MRTDIAGLVTWSAALFLIVFGLLRGNAEGWSSGIIVASLVAGGALLAVFIVVELRQTRPMLDMSLFRRPAFVGVSLATFAIGAGMFAIFPYLSIYMQDVIGLSPLGAGLRFLPLTVFIFVIPLATRSYTQRIPAWIFITVGFLFVAAALLVMHGLSESDWKTLLPGFVLGGIGVGLANPLLAAAALRAVDPARSGMASGINNACRLGGVAIGVAGLGAVLEHQVRSSLASTGHAALAPAVSSSGARVAGGDESLAHVARIAYIHGLNGALLVGAIAVFAGAVAAAALMRPRPDQVSATGAS